MNIFPPISIHLNRLRYEHGKCYDQLLIYVGNWWREQELFKSHIYIWMEPYDFKEQKLLEI